MAAVVMEDRERSGDGNEHAECISAVAVRVVCGTQCDHDARQVVDAEQSQAGYERRQPAALAAWFASQVQAILALRDRS